jgi:hypothetical protein
LTFSVAFESFQPITGHTPQIIEARRSVHRLQLATGGLEKVGRKPLGHLPSKTVSVTLSLKLRMMCGVLDQICPHSIVERY